MTIKDRITKWANGRVEAILINTSCHDFSEERVIREGNVKARNQFMADAINHLFNFHNTIAYVGGRYHLQSELPLSEETIKFLGVIKISKEMELQNLVKADKKYVYDAVRSLRIE